MRDLSVCGTRKCSIFRRAFFCKNTPSSESKNINNTYFFRIQIPKMGFSPNVQLTRPGRPDPADPTRPDPNTQSISSDTQNISSDTQIQVQKTKCKSRTQNISPKNKNISSDSQNISPKPKIQIQTPQNHPFLMKAIENKAK